MTFDREKVIHAARNGISLAIKTHVLPPQTEVDLEEILGVFLEELGQARLKDALAYCLKELTGNAKKANTKRVYFEEKGLRLDDPVDYAKGMERFKPDTLGNIQHYLELQQERDLYIKVKYLVQDGVLVLSVRNNTSMTSGELTRIYDRVARSRAFDTMAEAVDEVLDDSEGAGLGIVIMILMLRKMGLSEKSITFAQAGTETSVTLTIPMDSIKEEHVDSLASEVLQLADDLPPFPENLVRLIGLLSDPDVEFEALASQMSLDPALTADLIKYVNSAKYGVSRKIENLEEAVRLVGIQGLKDQVYPYGARKILDIYLAQQKHLWDDALRVSFYATELAHQFRLPREMQGLAQIGGVLSNMGQIVLSFAHPDQSEKILTFCRDRGFSVELFNDLTQAINPASLGARIAEKWNFPEDLVQIIRFQNRPQGAKPSLQPTASVVHLARCLVSVEQDLLSYGQINVGVLTALKLSDPELLKQAHARLQGLASATH